MSFQPILPFGGYSGWVFLNRTLESQQAAHQVGLQTDTDYFAEHIGDVRTADDLLADRRLLTVALGAFGLQDDVNNTYFIRRVLEDGVTDEEALANKLADKTYRKLSEAFGFGEGVAARTTLSGFADEIISAYQEMQFELDVGEQDEDFRLALNAKRELEEIAGNGTSNDAKWFSIMGSTPLRTVFETALGFPDSFSSLDIDEQLDRFKEKAERTFGTSDVSQFLGEEKLDDLIQTFLLRSELAAMSESMSSANTALVLLGAIQT